MNGCYVVTHGKNKAIENKSNKKIFLNYFSQDALWEERVSCSRIYQHGKYV